MSFQPPKGYTNAGSFKVGSVPWNKSSPRYCLICPNQIKTKPFLDAKYCSVVCYRVARRDFRHSIATRLKMQKSAKKGSENKMWRGGLTAINKLIRRGLEFKLWREAVFKRDNWTCVWCGKRGGVLHPDHIKPFSLFPELRFAVENGRTLCAPCHKKTDTWGRKILIYKKSLTILVMIIFLLLSAPTKASAVTYNFLEFTLPSGMKFWAVQIAYAAEIPEVMDRIAWCESGNRQFDESGNVLRGVVNRKDVGRFQINEYYHLEDSKRLGFDIYTEIGNTGYALYLYEKNGTRDWNWSRTCWE